MLRPKRQEAQACPDDLCWLVVNNQLMGTHLYAFSRDYCFSLCFGPIGGHREFSRVAVMTVVRLRNK